MTEVSESILSSLATSSSSLNSLNLATSMGIDHQKVVGAIKSLQSREEEIISVDIQPRIKLQLTSEGESVCKSGSHEYNVFQLAKNAETQLTQPELMAKMIDPKTAKLGFSKAMSLGYVKINKRDNKSYVVATDSADIVDSTRQHLESIRSGERLESKIVDELKKRKLVTQSEEKVFVLSKGKDFQVDVKAKPEPELTADMLTNNSWQSTSFKAYNLNALGSVPSSGHLHPLLKVRSELRQIFLEMGFEEMERKPFVESSFWNFDALFQPQQHPARDAHDTFFLSKPVNANHFDVNNTYVEDVGNVHSKGGYGSIGYKCSWLKSEAQKNVLRTHTTAVSARTLYKMAQQYLEADGKQRFKPRKLFSIDRVFRNETLDATHLAEFHQIEGVVAGENIRLSDLIGLMYDFFSRLGLKELRFKPAYNPYTEPSMEVFAFHNGLGKWIEIGNSGMFRPEMLRPMGMPENVNVLGFGLSVERPTMIKYGLDNIRDLCGHKVDLKMVQTSPICRLDKDSKSAESRLLELTSSRLDRVISRLQSAQLLINTISGKNGRADTEESVKIEETDDKQVEYLTIFVDPRHKAPLSMILWLRKMEVSSKVQNHSHSTLSGTALEVNEEWKKWFLLHQKSKNEDSKTLNVHVIFKAVGPNIITKMAIKEGNELKIIDVAGEANLLRLLHRKFDNLSHKKESNLLSITRLESQLDQISTFTSCSSFNSMEMLLAKIGKETSLHILTRLLLYSLLKQTNIENRKGVETFLKRVEDDCGIRPC